MQREKNAEFVLRCLRETGWNFRNLIIWEKSTSAVPIRYGFGKKYQIIAYATKGKPRVFNRLRYEPPLLAIHEYQRPDGILIADVWDDIKELTSGYFAGEEAIRTENGKFFTKTGQRFHKQQSPIELLTRIILSSTKPNDLVLDPFAGTGVTGVVAEQLSRNSILIEIDPLNYKLIQKRLANIRPADQVSKFYSKYIFTKSCDSNDPKYSKPIYDCKKEMKEIKKKLGKLSNENEEYQDLKNKLEKLNEKLKKLENIRIISDIWSNKKEGLDLQINGLKKEPKFNPDLSYLMRETLINILIDEFKIPKELIMQDKKIKSKNIIHDFDFFIGNDDIGFIMKLLYARDVRRARFWTEQVIIENKIISNLHKKLEFIVVLSGSAFKGFIDDLKLNLPHLASFLGWEKQLGIPSVSSKLQEMSSLISKILKIRDEKNKIVSEKRIKSKNRKSKRLDNYF